MEIGMKIFPQAYQLTQTFQFVGHRILRRNHTNLRGFFAVPRHSIRTAKQLISQGYMQV
jgi:hypothetical protein